jgi:Methyltransferase domain
MTITDRIDVVQQLLTDKPSFHLGGRAHWDALPSTLEAVRAAAKNGDSTIEIGVGASTVVFAASGADHIAISPDVKEHELVRAYCDRIGVDRSRVRFVEGLSDDALPSLLGRDRTIDVAFVDGAHSFPIPVIDWYYVTRSLKVGGKLLLDDIPIPAVGQIFRHMKLEPDWRLDGVFDARSAQFTLLALPDAEDNWISQPFNSAYPDFGFVGLPRRLGLQNAHRIRTLRRKAGERYPGLRRAYKRLV